MNWEQAWDSLNSEFALPLQPEGSMTVIQFCAKFGKNRSTATNHLRALEKQGRVRVVECFVPDGRGRMLPQKAYLPVK